ncbi:MAG: N-6 DNA methylase, partial [Clostridiaceae bacterium]|nr:N-6 DNA methylase [Clostridiaceae bacterium]
MAYTWFNRLIAIRFMEVNGYLPSGIRMLSSQDADRIEPDCVRDYARLDFLNQDTATQLAAESDEKLYRYILVEQCNALGKIMPKMFTHIGGMAALLLPERLYIKDGLVYDLTHSISEEDFGEQVEIIGWLYQYYISEKKDEVFAALKKNVKITRENIPAATQLFTPDWIVKYMVENSLGRLWLEHLAANGEGFYFLYSDDGSDAAASVVTADSVKELKSNWKYYINQAKQEPDVERQLEKIRSENKAMRPVDIKFIDPCMGSGHILVYAFDVLYQIYSSQGYSERDIPDLILQNNIYGLDIDERACQLAYFALMMKARSYNRRFFRREDVPQPQVYSPQGYEDGMEYGSLVKVDELEKKPLEKEVVTLFDTPYETELNTWNFRRLLHQKYDVVVTNPPYMGASGMSGKLAKYVKQNYPTGKSDMFAVFMLRVFEMQKESGFFALMTSYTWLFLVAYSELREKILRDVSLYSLVQPEYHSFFAEAFVPICTFVMRKLSANYTGKYIRLEQFTGASLQETKTIEAINDPDCPYLYTINQDEFNKIPKSPIAYWLKPSTIDLFETNPPLSEYADLRQGLITGDNDRFLRFWHECENIDISIDSPRKWYFYHKGGEYRKWYGNISLVVNWENDGFDIMNF